MKTVQALALLVCLVTVAGSFSRAADLGYLTISNEDQVAIATGLLGHAYAKIGDRFLIMADSSQQTQLRAQGLVFEALQTNAPLRSLYLVWPRKAGTAPRDAGTLPQAVSLDGGMAVIDANPAAAQSLANEGTWFVNRLEDRTIYFNYVAPSVPYRFAPTDVFPSDSLAGLISQDSLLAYDQRLEAFQTRYIYTDSINRARDWIVNKFHQWGYTQVTMPSFVFNGRTCYNVQVVKPGYAEPDKVIVIGGHYDSWDSQSPGPYVYAPGADDDGSGTALTMEVARILADVPLRKTVIFIPFTAEEVGLVGSQVAAQTFKAAGTKLEAMYNYDMVAFTANDVWDISLSSGPNTAYMNVSVAAANRLTTLLPKIVAMGSSSDHYPFYQQGFSICDNIESDFNTAGWHTNIDNWGRLNFPYFREVARMAIASVAQVATSAWPSSITNIIDQGDGQRLEVYWGECNPSYQYTLYWGTASGAYTDSMTIAPGQCSQMLTGLIEGQRYYFAVYGKPADGYRAVTAYEGSEMPLLYPRTPGTVVADPGEKTIIVSWKPNKEADIATYSVYRSVGDSGAFTPYLSNLTDTTFIDTAVVSNTRYWYKISAVDHTGYESAPSTPVFSYPATFDAGILVVDDMYQDYSYCPDQAHQNAWFDSLFGWNHAVFSIDQDPDKLDKGNAGRFSSILWIDDDFFYKGEAGSQTTINWYTSHVTNMFACGFKMIQDWSMNTPVPTSHPLYQQFMVSAYNYYSSDRWIGATGQAGWPTVSLDMSRGVRNMIDVAVLTPRPGATVIYTYNSLTGDPNDQGKPVGLAYDGPLGKRVVLSFPLYYLSLSSAKALATKVKAYFGEVTPSMPGDVDGNGRVNLVDLTTLIGFLCANISSVPDPNGADVDGSCRINLVDLSSLISYLTKAYPLPKPGCVLP